jgi:putative oxidoreductase
MVAEMKQKSGMEKMAQGAKEKLGKAADDVKGALGMKPKPVTDKYRDVGLLVLRIALAMLMLHGISKLSNLDGTGAFFGKLGVPAAGVMALLIGLLETFGALAILLGIGTRLFGVLVALDLLTAVILTNPFKGIQPHELELWFMLAGLAIALTGPGRYSLEEKLAGGKESILHKI